MLCLPQPEKPFLLARVGVGESGVGYIGGFGLNPIGRLWIEAREEYHIRPARLMRRELGVDVETVTHWVFLNWGVAASWMFQSSYSSMNNRSRRKGGINMPWGALDLRSPKPHLFLAIRPFYPGVVISYWFQSLGGNMRTQPRRV